MVDVGRQNGTAFCNFLADEFRGDVGFNTQFAAVHVLADSHIFHFRRDDALFGIVHLRTAFAGFSPVRQGNVFETQMIQRMVVAAHPSVFGGDFRKLFYVAALDYPFFTQTGQTFFQVYFNIRITERSAGIIDIHVGIGSNDFLAVLEGGAGNLFHFAHGNTDFRK